MAHVTAGRMLQAQNRAWNKGRPPLSWKALGVLAWLQEMGPHNTSALVAAGPDGRVSVQSGLAELAAAGLVQRTVYRGPTGTYSAHEWSVVDL